MNPDSRPKIRARLSDSNKIICLHSNADLDCVGSAIAILLFYGNARICAPAGVSHLGKNMMESMGIQYSEMLDLDDGEVPVIVDSHDDSSIGYTGVYWDKAIIIDHHRLNTDILADLSLIDENAESTCQLVWEIMDWPENIHSDIGKALLGGILADTGHLRRGRPETLIAAAEILKSSGLLMEDIEQVFETRDNQEMSRRISRMKGAQRLRFERIGKWIIAFSEVGAFESAVCHGLIGLGADIAIVGSQKDDEFRATARANRDAINAGIHLGDIMFSISNEINGEGGGHDGAAGLSGSGDVEAILNICVQNCLEVLRATR